LGQSNAPAGKRKGADKREKKTRGMTSPKQTKRKKKDLEKEGYSREWPGQGIENNEPHPAKANRE